MPNTDPLLRGMWALVFAREEAVRGTVVDALYNLHLKDEPGAGGGEGHTQRPCCTTAMLRLCSLQLKKKIWVERDTNLLLPTYSN